MKRLDKILTLWKALSKPGAHDYSPPNKDKDAQSKKNIETGLTKLREVGKKGMVAGTAEGTAFENKRDITTPVMRNYCRSIKAIKNAKYLKRVKGLTAVVMSLTLTNPDDESGLGNEAALDSVNMTALETALKQGDEPEPADTGAAAQATPAGANGKAAPAQPAPARGAAAPPPARGTAPAAQPAAAATKAPPARPAATAPRPAQPQNPARPAAPAPAQAANKPAAAPPAGKQAGELNLLIKELQGPLVEEIAALKNGQKATLTTLRNEALKLAEAGHLDHARTKVAQLKAALPSNELSLMIKELQGPLVEQIAKVKDGKLQAQLVGLRNDALKEAEAGNLEHARPMHKYIKSLLPGSPAAAPKAPAAPPAKWAAAKPSTPPKPTTPPPPDAGNAALQKARVRIDEIQAHCNDLAAQHPRFAGEIQPLQDTLRVAATKPNADQILTVCEVVNKKALAIGARARTAAPTPPPPVPTDRVDLEEPPAPDAMDRIEIPEQAAPVDPKQAQLAEIRGQLEQFVREAEEARHYLVESVYPSVESLINKAKDYAGYCKSPTADPTIYEGELAFLRHMLATYMADSKNRRERSDPAELADLRRQLVGFVGEIENAASKVPPAWQGWTNDLIRRSKESISSSEKEFGDAARIKNDLATMRQELMDLQAEAQEKAAVISSATPQIRTGFAKHKKSLDNQFIHMAGNAEIIEELAQEQGLSKQVTKKILDDYVNELQGAARGLVKGGKFDWKPCHMINPILEAATRPELEPDQAEAVAIYSGEDTHQGYKHLNPFLWKGKKPDPPSDKHHELLKAAFAKTKPFEQPIRVTRGLKFDTPEATDSFLKQFKDAVGTDQAVRLAGYISTGTAGTPGTFAGGNIEFVIIARQGLDLSPYTRAPKEKELLLNDNTPVKVKSCVQDSTGKWTVTVQQIVWKSAKPTGASQ